MRDGPRGFGQDFSCPGLLRCRLCTAAAFAYGAFTRCGRPFQNVRLAFAVPFAGGPTTPVGAETPPVWALARSLATTCAIIGLFSLPPGTEMFQFPGFASASRMPDSLPAGCPIRKSTDQGIFAPTRSLSQLITSFVASESPGILHVPFSPFSLTLVQSVENLPRTARSGETFLIPRRSLLSRLCISFTRDERPRSRFLIDCCLLVVF